jgi:hypothetical protein
MKRDGRKDRALRNGPSVAEVHDHILDDIVRGAFEELVTHTFGVEAAEQAIAASRDVVSDN